MIQNFQEILKEIGFEELIPIQKIPKSCSKCLTPVIDFDKVKDWFCANVITCGKTFHSVDCLKFELDSNTLVLIELKDAQETLKRKSEKEREEVFKNFEFYEKLLDSLLISIGLSGRKIFEKIKIRYYCVVDLPEEEFEVYRLCFEESINNCRNLKFLNQRMNEVHMLRAQNFDEVFAIFTAQSKKS